MKLINPSYEIMTPINGEEILKQIELAARTCYKSEGKIEYEDEIIKDGFGIYQHLKDKIAKSARPLISKLIKNGHEAMIEFGGMISVKFTVTRGFSHEAVRHRLSSFAQESQRYVNYSETGGTGDCVFIEIKQHLKNPAISLDIWLNHMIACEVAYNAMINAGESPQIARGVLPNSTKTEICISSNIRQWRHIFKLRTANAAHPDMQELMRPLLDEFKQRIPILFDDINY